MISSAESCSNRTSVTPVRTECARPESCSSMWRASSVERGLFRMRPSRSTTVSAAMTIPGPTARAATNSALAAARRATRSCGVSPGMGVSSIAEDITVNCTPALRRISARRAEEEARISFMDTLREEYYRADAKTACADTRRSDVSLCDGGVGLFSCLADYRLVLIQIFAVGAGPHTGGLFPAPSD